MTVKSSKITARITAELNAKLEELCTADDVPRSYVIERALEDYLNHPESHGPIRSMRTDIARKLVGEHAGHPQYWHQPRHLKLWERLDVLAEGGELALEVASRAALVCARRECWPSAEGSTMRP